MTAYKFHFRRNVFVSIKNKIKKKQRDKHIGTDEQIIQTHIEIKTNIKSSTSTIKNLLKSTNFILFLN